MFVLLLVGGCATGPAIAPRPEALEGCWIERLGRDEARTMRWFADGASWSGEASVFRNGAGRSLDLRLERSGDGWRICGEAYGRTIQASCAPAYFGPAPAPLRGAWSEITVSAERLKMVARGFNEAPRVIIDAVRDGCD